jgi:uncharacterized membrane protein
MLEQHRRPPGSARGSFVWWSPRLIWDQPDWLGVPHGRDVVDAMVWIPLVTFRQVAADLPLATGVPDGHGHNYHRETGHHLSAGGSVHMQPPGTVNGGWRP